MAGTLTPTPFQTVLDDTGVAVSGALIYTYTAGSTTAAATYTTSALSVANANPIVADSAGRYVAYLSAGANMKFVYKTAAGATIRTQDNVLSVPGAAVNLDIQGTVGVAVTAGQVCYLSSGAEATPLTPGLWYLTDADFAVSSTTCQSIGMAVSAIPINTAGTIRIAGLADTAAAVVVGSTYYVSATAGAITTSAPALSRTVGVSDTTSTLILAATSAVTATIPNPITQDLLFTDATYDIGKSGASRPRDLFQSRNATIGGTLGVTGAATLSSTLAVTGATTLTGGLNTPLVVAQGGSGVATHTAYGVIVGGTTSTAATQTITPGTSGYLLTSGGASAVPTWAAAVTPTTLQAVCNGRLTLTSGTPVTTADVTGATSIYFAPYTGSQISLYDGSTAWNTRTFTQITIALGTLTSGLPYDLFAYDNATVVAFDAPVAWTNGTTRATALTTQDGVLVKTGATTRRYIGTFHTTSTTTTEDSFAKRFLSNYYNRVSSLVRVQDTTDSWAYTTATWRQANAAATNQVALVVGWAEDEITVHVSVASVNSSADITRQVGIGQNTVTAPTALNMPSYQSNAGASSNMIHHSTFTVVPVVGYHYFAWLERSNASGTTTWVGDGGDATLNGTGGIYGTWRR